MAKNTSFTSFVLALALFFGVSGLLSATPKQDTLDSIGALKAHILDTSPLSGTGISTNLATIRANRSLLGTETDIITAAFDLVASYDSVFSPMWTKANPITEFKRNEVADSNIHWAIYQVSQAIVDFAFTPASLAANESTLNGLKLALADRFPGAVAAPTIVDSHTVTMNASYPDTFGWQRQQDNLPARKPTGTYLAPGTVVTVTVPEKIVNKGFSIRVGSHSWDLENRRIQVRRLDRISLVFPITSTTVKVANPLGGGIYIEVPYEQDQGVIDVTVTGAVRAPFFSKNSVTGHNTTVSEWLNVERNHPAPWADIQTEKCMINVPTIWLKALNDPVKLMEDWDHSMDIMNDLMGFPRLRGKESTYSQADVILRYHAHSPGYPDVNVIFNPDRVYEDTFGNYLTRGPQYSQSFVFHEQGHAYFFKKFTGEGESAINLPHVAVMNRGFGKSWDLSLRGSATDGKNTRTMDETALAWMTSFNFSPLKVPMTESEMAYQMKGHTKYVEIARLFGWDKLGDYFRQLVTDNISTRSGRASNDDLIVRLANATGTDIRPLLDFWGRPPTNFSDVANRIANAGHQPSNEIYDKLRYYRSLIPRNNTEFRDFARKWWGEVPSATTREVTESNHGRQWSSTDHSGGSPVLPDGEIYNEASHLRLQNRIDELLDLYFPDGDPIPDLEAPEIVSFGLPTNADEIYRNEVVGFSVSFSEPIDQSSVDPSDFRLFTDTSAYIESISRTSDPTVFTVRVRTENVGLVRLAVAPESVVVDIAGNPLDAETLAKVSSSLKVRATPVLEGQLGILDLSANGGINPKTGLEWRPGDTYRLAFVTSNRRSATSTNIADYNAFVQAAANSSTTYPEMGRATWKVLGSTSAVSARENTGTENLSAGQGEPIFLLDGKQVLARNNDDLWDGWPLRFPAASSPNGQSIYLTPYINEQGSEVLSDPFGPNVATGTNGGGTTASTRFLGGSTESPPKVIHGNLRPNLSTRGISRFNAPASNLFRFYGISEPLSLIIKSDYKVWREQYPELDLGDPEGDYDKDGISNDEERIWGLDPRSGASARQLVIANRQSGRFSYTRRDVNQSGLTYSIWTSPDLQTWTEDISATQAPNPIGSNGVQSVAVELSPALRERSKLFIKVVANQ